MTYDPFWRDRPLAPQQDQSQMERDLIRKHMEQRALTDARLEIEELKRKLAAERVVLVDANRRAENAVQHWQKALLANLQHVSAKLEALFKLMDEMVTFQKSRGRTIVLDKATGKPRSPNKTPKPLRAGKRAKSDRQAKAWAKAGQRTRGAQRP